MSISRFSERFVRFNDEAIYEKTFKERGVRHISHYATAEFPEITPEQIEALSLREHIWKQGDRFYKLAHEHYGSSDLWWIIAWFNKKPTESHMKFGELIYIPAPLERMFLYLDL
tara:strand:+ start:1617 stop:1958 length:342 start_codon:yes stop_codon:yes gene_type:complete